MHSTRTCKVRAIPLSKSTRFSFLLPLSFYRASTRLHRALNILALSLRPVQPAAGLQISSCLILTSSADRFPAYHHDPRIGSTNLGFETVPAGEDTVP